MHGDYGLHNCRVARDGRIAAVVDWEISTLGDPTGRPRLLHQHVGRDPRRRQPATTRPPLLPGFCGRQVLIDRYADRTGADLSQLDYYRCFNHWKTVCIVQGVYARYLHGQKSTEGVDVDDFPGRIERDAAAGGRAADRLSS